MLPKNRRIRLKNDFDRLFKEGKFISWSFLTLVYAKNDLDISRVAVIVSKKVDKRAVIRNSVKRKAIEIIRLNLGKIKPSFDLVLITKPGIKDKKYKEIEIVVIKLLSKAKIFN